MATSLLVPEITTHHDKYHGEREVISLKRIHVHTNEAPPILEVTKGLERQESTYLKYTGEIIRLDPTEVIPMQTRTVDIILSNVAEILQFLNKEGYDPKELPPCVVKFRGRYYIINGHHQTAAFIERGQSLWIYDVYEYLGPDDFNIFSRAVKSLGKKINLLDSPPKQSQKPFEMVNTYILELQRTYEETGIAHLRVDENGDPISVSEECIDIQLEEDGFTSHWGPEQTSGKKSVYTKCKHKIMDWKHASASNIRSFDDKWRKKLIRSGKFLSDGKVNSDGRKCYMVCTDNPNSDGVKLFLQTLFSDKPVKFLSYSKETDDPSKVIENERSYLIKAYETYKKAVAVNYKMKRKFEDERICAIIESVELHKPCTYKQFLTLFEWWAVAQLDNEGIDVTQRDVTDSNT